MNSKNNVQKYFYHFATSTKSALSTLKSTPTMTSVESLMEQLTKVNVVHFLLQRHN